MNNTHNSNDNTSCHISSICQIYSIDLNIPNIFHKYFITEHVIFHFCLICFLDDIQTVLWLHKLIKVTDQ